MLKKNDLPIDLIDNCYIDLYEGSYCLFYKGIPLILVNYQFWTEDITVLGDYIDYGDNEKGYTILIDIPSYDDKGNLLKLDHVYYGLFGNLIEFENWLNEPYFIY